MLGSKARELTFSNWRGLKRKPSTWLFPNRRRRGTDAPIDSKVVWYACQQAAKRAGLIKKSH